MSLREVVLACCGLLAIGAVVVLIWPQLVWKRPHSLSTSVRIDARFPAVIRVVVNGKQLTGYSLMGMSDLGSAPYKGRMDQDFEVELEWLETLPGLPYAAKFTVPADQLSRYDENRDHADLTIELGHGGAFVVQTPRQDLLDHLRNGMEDLITPEMDEPVVLQKHCAPVLDTSDPRYETLVTWRNEAALEQAERYQAGARDRGEDFDAPSPCQTGGS